MKFLRGWILGLGAAIAGVLPLSAQIVDWTLNGTIDTISDPTSATALSSIFSAGEKFQLKFQGDASALPSFSLPAQGITTFDLQQGNLTLGSTSYAFNSSSLALSRSSFATTVAFGGFFASPTFSVTASLRGSGDLYPGNAYPVSFPPLSSFNLASSFTVSGPFSSNGHFEADGVITSIEASAPSAASAVPEASTYSAFAALSLFVLCFFRRFRKSK